MTNNIFLIQTNPTIADCKGNFEQISAAIKNIKNADLVILNKLAILGFPYFDLLTKNSYIINTQKKYIKQLAEIVNIPLIINYIDYEDNKITEKFALIKNHKIQQKFNKNNAIFELNNEKIQIFSTENFQDTFNLEIEIERQVTSLIILDADNSIKGKEYQRNKILSDLAKEKKVTVYYNNQYGATDEYSFDGSSRIYQSSGELFTRAKSFEFDIINNIDKRIEKLPQGTEKEFNPNKPFSLNYEDDMERTYLSVLQGIRDYFRKNNFTKAVLGLSGGLDSTVSAVLLADALGKENVLGVSMPSKISSQSSKDDAKDLAENLGIEFITVPISDITEPTNQVLTNTFSAISNKFEPQSTSYVNDNVQARTRAIILWGISNQYKSMFPIATSDKSELYMGYATINGDMSGSFAPIADITKTKLFALGDWLNKNRQEKNAIPQSVLEKSPGAELAINQKTGKLLLAEEALMPYEFMDEIIYRIENQQCDYNSLLQSDFIYEKTHNLSLETKKEWINKFYKRMFTATYKGSIMPPRIILEPRTINKTKNPITANKIELE